VAIEGGVPIIVNGQIIGAIGVSGDSSDHDGICATAGAAALK
jgi:glc operon protein GlcG